MLRVLHLNTQFASLGGVEAVLRFHHEQDAGLGMDSRFISLWEDSREGFPRTAFAAFSRQLSVRDARRRVAGAWPAFRPTTVVHHTTWGQAFLADLDGSARRVLFLHSDTPGLAQQLAARVPLMDGIIAVSDILLERARSAAPAWPASRFLRIDYPIHPPPWLTGRKPRQPGSPLVLGYAGRLSTEQKRIERFIELSRHLSSARFPWRLEFLGDGPERALLESALPNRTQHVFHGRRAGEDYWRIVDGWDAILFTSDFEGTPIALIEALATGAVPVHPAIGSGGDAYAREISPRLAYPAADMEAMARAVQELADWTPLQRNEATLRARAIAARHDARHYLTRFRDFLTEIEALPPLPKPAPRRWGFPLDRLSFAHWEWIASLRRR
jgi:glycosyltransferase involved in cell wall biosynthesis